MLCNVKGIIVLIGDASVLEYCIEVAYRPLSIRAFAQVLEFLATAPTPAEILTFRPTPALQTQINRLLSKNKAGTLTADEESELDRIGDLEHILIALKARSRQTPSLNSTELTA